VKANTIVTAALSAVIGAALTLSVALPACGSKPTESPVPETQELLTCAEQETTKPTPLIIDLADAELLGRTIWGEAGGIESETHRAAVAWCILNRVDAWDMTIEEVVTAPGQFHGYRPWGECPQEHIDLAKDVLIRWTQEKLEGGYTGRVLPESYLYFIGDGYYNYFTEEWQTEDYWDWSSRSPYND
jgi:hypothetical protein